jgi:hypothetical protein
MATAESRLRAVGVVLSLTVGALIGSLLGGFVLAIILGDLGYEVTDPVAFLSIAAIGQLVFLGVAYVYRGVRNGRPELSVAPISGREVTVVGGGFLLVTLVGEVPSRVLGLVEFTPTSFVQQATAGNLGVFAGLAVLSALFIAPIEEYLFRGTIQGRLREAFGPVGAVLGASLLFGSLHALSFSGSVDSLLGTVSLIVLLGILLGASYEYTDNLTVPILIHGAYNALHYVLDYLTVGV